MASLVHLTTLSPSELGGELERAGYRILEVCTVSEVLYLMEHHDVDAIVIGPDVEDPELAEVHLRRTCIKLERGFKFSDLIWELSNLYGTPTTLQ